ncbi:hypothetical protein IH970_07350 [candidate division KSB1 bacterium]|nr:hypothetical protein [candidate division KSB1 bacterium]
MMSTFPFKKYDVMPTPIVDPNAPLAFESQSQGHLKAARLFNELCALVDEDSLSVSERRYVALIRQASSLSEQYHHLLMMLAVLGQQIVDDDAMSRDASNDGDRKPPEITNG